MRGVRRLKKKKTCHKDMGTRNVQMDLFNCSSMHFNWTYDSSVYKIKNLTSTQYFFSVLVIPARNQLVRNKSAHSFNLPRPFLRVTEHLVCLLDGIERTRAFFDVVWVLICAKEKKRVQ